MTIDKSRTVSFIYNQTKNSPIFTSDRSKLQLRLDRAISDMIEDGFDTFLVLLDKGFGTMAAESVLKAKSQHLNIKLVIVFPYLDDGIGLDNTPAERNHIICTQTDYVTYISDKYICGIPLNPDNFLIDNSSATILYLEKYSTHARYVLDRVLNNSLIMINLCFR